MLLLLTVRNQNVLHWGNIPMELDSHQVLFKIFFKQFQRGNTSRQLGDLRNETYYFKIKKGQMLNIFRNLLLNYT